MPIPRRPIALVLLLLHLPGCTSYRSTSLAPEAAVAGERAVQVTLIDGDRLTVRDPWVRNDSLGGATSDNPDWAVPLTSLTELRTKRTDVAKTTVTVIGVGALVFLGAVVIAYCNDSSLGGC